MSASSHLFLKIREANYELIPEQYREQFELLTVEPDDLSDYKDDIEYNRLAKNKRKASKELRDYLYNKRHP